MDIDASTCPCYCHTTTPDASCTILGGCGYLHATRHRCRRGDRCADWDQVDTVEPDGSRGRVRIGAPINSSTGLCLVCAGRAGQAVAELPRDYTELSLILGRTSIGGGEPVAGTPGLSVPVRLDVEALRAGMVAETTCWAEVVAERIGVTWNSDLMDRHTRPGWALQRACHLLAAAMSPWLAVRDWTRMMWHPDGQAADPEPQDGVDGAIALIELHHQARRLCGVTRLVHRMPVPCITCGRRALHRDNGDDQVYCTYCDRVYSGGDYSQVVSVLASAAG